MLLKKSLSDVAMSNVLVNIVSLSTCNLGGGGAADLGSSSSTYWKNCLQSVLQISIRVI